MKKGKFDTSTIIPTLGVNAAGVKPKWKPGIPVELGCQYRAFEVDCSSFTHTTPRRELHVELRCPPAGVTADAILALPEIPQNGEAHANPAYRVCKRGAVKIGPAHWAIWVHYRDIEQEGTK